jgi:hypothetical protein
LQLICELEIALGVLFGKKSQAFWKRVMDHPFISKELQELATRMSGRMGCF